MSDVHDRAFGSIADPSMGHNNIKWIKEGYNGSGSGLR